jgi:hypothetical protein
MSDRTSAEIFAIIFTELAKNPTDEHKAIAKKIWRKRTQYDFSDYQIGCDDALVKLGLAVKVDDEVSYVG